MSTANNAVEAGLEEFGQALGLVLELDENGACALDYDDDQQCTIEYTEARQTLLIWTELLPVPQTGRTALLEKALSLNANPFTTGGAALGYDAAKQCLTLSYLCPASSLQAAEVASTIGDFLLLAIDLRDRLREDQPEETTALPHSPQAIIYG